jgi:acyl-CoA synthetase (AMP-forming)/AMP-acid ligase II
MFFARVYILKVFNCFGDSLSFSVRARGLTFEIKLVELGKLHIHEEIIPELLDSMVEEIRSNGVLKHPIIADANTLVVLDGMHRVAALRKIECRCIPACLVDYHSPKVKVGCWYRTVSGEASTSVLLDLLRRLEIKVDKARPAEARRALENREAVAAILSKNDCHKIYARARGIREAYAWVGRIEKIFASGGLNVSYEMERDAEEGVKSGRAIAAVMTPRATKGEVLEAALAKKLFAHKTTRHVVPARPMCVDVPLKWLMGKSIEEANEMLLEHLARREMKRLPRGSVFEGRRYEEELVVFE